ncbi:MAG: hypothetical protein ACK56F_30600, partial [bacterium]
MKLTDTGPTIVAKNLTEGRRRLFSSQQLLLYYILFVLKPECRNPDPIIDLWYRYIRRLAKGFWSLIIMLVLIKLQAKLYFYGQLILGISVAAALFFS